MSNRAFKRKDVLSLMRCWLLQLNLNFKRPLLWFLNYWFDVFLNYKVIFSCCYKSNNVKMYKGNLIITAPFISSPMLLKDSVIADWRGPSTLCSLFCTYIYKTIFSCIIKIFPWNRTILCTLIYILLFFHLEYILKNPNRSRHRSSSILFHFYYYFLHTHTHTCTQIFM